MKRSAAVVVSLAVLGVASSLASAAVTARIEIIASNDVPFGQPGYQEFGRHEWTLSNPNPDSGSFSWTGGQPITFSDGSQVHDVGFNWVEDPVVGSSFNLTAGNSNTTFTVNSAIVSFGTINNAVGFARASVSVYDSPLTPGSISFNGLQGGGNAFRAFFNDPTASLSRDFATILNVGTQTVVPGSSTNYDADTGAFAPVGYDVDMIQSQFRFSLSARDRAAGTSYFEIVPAPGAVSLLGLGGLLAARRRRTA